jgi:AP-1 complex subunit gamma-1
VRSAKTQSDEREIVANELAEIRGLLRKEQPEVRQRCMAKLLYLHTLGYSTSFAQMECLKLIVSPFYSDKRIGYLGLMILLDEKAEVTMLVTNSLKTDLGHPNHFIVGLALASLANIGSEEMCRECAPELEKILAGNNPYLKKKAGAAALRSLRKAPDTAGAWYTPAGLMLSERNHGVVLVGATLLLEALRTEPSLLSPADAVKISSCCVKSLKALTVSGYAPEFDVSGVTDPFLQVALLRVMRLTGAVSAAAAEVMNDILAQVATNTESTRNVGNAILYEAVQTILAIRCDANLKVLAINVLGKFLRQRDNNIRYVALTTLGRVVSVDQTAVQRHRNTIVDCLKDPDVSIRRRALDLIYSLVNGSNVRVLVRELLNFLLLSDVQFRPDLTAKLCAVAERHAPSADWYLDTVLRIMDLAGAYVPDSVTSSLVFMVGNKPALHEYAARKMYTILATGDTLDQPAGLLQACLWVLGEYGDVAVEGSPDSPSASLASLPPRPSADDVIAAVASVTRSLAAGMRDDPTTLGFAIVSLAKLSERFDAGTAPGGVDLTSLAANANIDIAQRSSELAALLTTVDADTRSTVLDRMPVPEADPEDVARAEAAEEAAGGGEGGEEEEERVAQVKEQRAAPQPTVNLLDLDDDLSPSPAPAIPTSTPAATTSSLLMDLGDLTLTSTPAPTPVAAAPAAPALLPGQFVGFTIPSVIRAVFDAQRHPTNTGLVMYRATLHPDSATPLSGVKVLFAAPKYCQLKLEPASSANAAPSSPITQVVKVSNSAHGAGKPILLKAKVEVASANISQTVDVTIPTNFQ